MATVLILKPPSCDDYNRNYLRNFSLNVRKGILNLEMNIISPLHDGLRMNMNFLSRMSNSTSFRNYYHYSLDMCNLLRYQTINLFKRWVSTFHLYGNFKKTCPIPSNYYYIKDYNINELAIPSFLFSGYYRIFINMVQHKYRNQSRDFIIACKVEVHIK
ncbi:hypothetical protein KR093_011304 [Drosophila rubida]|uniref:MD-2-related lipid-recognition domain-containing protein n=1 Tax=Drosophila rubida TaxID=30044 RepID=A0AAD4K4Z7_9MUSC|nr:hypothetical protein KR093_011304 [Drosophila rubida]